MTPERQFEDGDRLPERQLRAVWETDAMTPQLRAVVHEFGYAITKAFIAAGVTSPAQIRRLVYECWKGARNPHEGNNRHRGDSPILAQLDWLLIQAEAKITAKTLLRILYQNHHVILPREPMEVMVEASIATVRNHDEAMTKHRKHLLRLREAMTAGVRQLWPFLPEDKGAA